MQGALPVQDVAAQHFARSKTTMRVVGSRSSAEDPDALAAASPRSSRPRSRRRGAWPRSSWRVPCSVATVTQHLVDELQLDAAVGFGSHREAFCEACDGVYQCINQIPELLRQRPP